MSTQSLTTDTYPIPVGTVYYFASTTGANGGFLLADGRELSRETYWELFSYIGTGYGDGDGSTTFNIPDLLTYPYIYGASAPSYTPNAGGASASGGFTIPTGALPSLTKTKFSSSLTFSANTGTDSGGNPLTHAYGFPTRKFDGGGVGTNTILSDSSTGTGASVSMDTLTVSYSNPSQTAVSPAISGTGISAGGLQMVAYIKAWSNVGSKPFQQSIQLPTVPPSDSFNAPYENIPYLAGLTFP
jgi:microcystin-dependent protein